MRLFREFEGVEESASEYEYEETVSYLLDREQLLYDTVVSDLEEYLSEYNYRLVQTG